MAIRTDYELIDILPGSGDFSISATDLDNNTQVITSTDNTILYFKHKYATRKYPVIRGMEPATKNDAISDFNQDFRAWVNNRQHNIDKLYQSMFDYDYSPIENVDRYENESINTDNDTTYGKTSTESGSDSVTYGKTLSKTGTDTDAKTGNETLGFSGGETNETQKAGFNTPNAYTPDTKNIQSFQSRQNTTTYNTSDTTTHNTTDTEGGTDRTTYGKTITDSGTDANDVSTERELRVHGNIGVTSNVDLLRQEEDYRLQSLTELLLDNFINDYTYYS